MSEAQLDHAVGARIKAYRLSKGMSQVEFADRIGISKSYLNHIEAGRRRVPDPVMDAIGDLLHEEDPSYEVWTVVVWRQGDDTAHFVNLRATSLVGATEAASALPYPVWTESPPKAGVDND